ncbi:MAG TPA: hypothetical protein VNS32_19750, partial [Flavisolibacter sp.]|nr:hypothetical protein [Flavisolibacter sp.]
KKSIFSSTSHNCWWGVYPDNYKENGINIYEFMLLFKKGATVPILPANKPPVANAGTDKSITLPTSSLTLSGSGTDTDNGISSYAWTKVSGPAATISAPASTSTAISGLTAGSYVFRLTVKDKELATATNDVTVTVNGSGTTSTPTPPPPTTTSPKPTSFYASAGADQTITLPTNSVTVTGKATDVGGTVTKYRWSLASGPSQYTIKDSTAASTTISNLTTGSYTFRLTVYDASGVTTSDAMLVTVNGSSSSTGTVTAPKPTTFYASAGADQTITLPTDSVTVTGKATDVGGTISKYRWSKISGPSQFTIKDSTAASTAISNLTSGSYTFRLTVTDLSGVATSDALVVTVNGSTSTSTASTGTVAAPKPTTFYASAGPDASIVLPVDSIALNGKATNVGGTVTKYVWSKISGPAQYKFTDSTKAATKIKGLVEGTYTFRLMVYDASGVYTSDAVDIKVSLAGTTAAVNTATTASTLQVAQTSVNINPEKVTDKFILSVNNDQTGTMKVQLINTAGTSAKTYLLQKPAAGAIQSYLSVGDVPAGNYTVQVEVGSYSASTVLVKL